MNIKDFSNEELLGMVEKIAKRLDYCPIKDDKIEFIEVMEVGSNCSNSVIIKGVDRGAIDGMESYVFSSGNTCVKRSRKFREICSEMFGQKHVSFHFVLSVIQYLNIACQASPCNLLSHWVNFLYE